MKRVAALYLPHWPIERLRAGALTAAPPEPRVRSAQDALAAAATAEQEHACSVPREAGFRPGARWARDARAEQAAQIAALPAHQRPPMRELGRRSEAAEHPFKAMRPDEAARGAGPRVLEPATPGALHRERGAAEGSGGGARRRARALPPLRVTPAPEAGKSEPTVTVQRSGNRVTIAAACPAAQALGLQPGMALTAARARVPGLVVHSADPSGDAADLERLATLAARRWSPVVMRAADDGLFLDATGVAHLFRGEQAMARRIVRLLARLGFSARVAIADTAGAAWALATRRTEAVTCCPPGAHRDAIAPLPVSALRVDPAAVELLRRLGVERIGTLATMPRAPLTRRFGHELVTRLDQALGLAPEPFDPLVPPERIAVGRRFAEPILTAEAIAHWLARLVPELGEALARAGLGARAVALVAERVDGEAQSLRIGLARASRDPAHLVRLLARRIEAIDPGFGIDALTLHVLRAERLGPTELVERLDAQGTPDLAPLVDTLATRIGMRRMWRSRAIESDVPERSVGRAPVLNPPAPPAPRLRADDVRRLAAQAPLPPWHARWPRPARLLRRPERVDDVLALLPDQPPRRFTWRGETHRVVRADGPERVHGEWWKRLSEIHGVRDYYRVEDEAGRRYWLFRKGDGERAATGDLSWWLHGVFG